MFENPFRSSSKKSKEKAAEKAKEYKKEAYAEKKTSRAEKRRERLQEWEKMSEEERKEKYGKRYERAKELYDLEKSRIEAVKVESELNKRNKITSKIWNAISFKDKKSIEELQKEYNEKIKEYKEKRAERVSDNVIATLNQNIKMAEQRALEHMNQSKFEKLKKGWKWLGDQNLDKLLKKFGKEPKSKFGKFAARFISIRTAISGGLIGLSAGIGSFSVGLTAYGARRTMGGVGAGAMSYDIMRTAREAKELTFSKEDVENMSEEDLEEKMAEFEARAATNGENFQYDRNYKRLREEYSKRVNNKEELTSALTKLDEVLREKDEKIRKKERHRKQIAAGIGILTAGAFSAGKLMDALEDYPDLLEKLGISPDDSPEEIKEKTKEAIDTNPSIDKSTLQEAAQDDTARANTVVDSLESGEIPVDEESGKETIQTKAIETIKEGGSVWEAAQKMIEDGDITEEEFWEAWSNDSSTVELPTGREVHISEVDLSHKGDQVVFVPGDGDTPAHFEVKDLADDSFNLGSSQNLYDIYKEMGKEVPEWLEEAAKWDVTYEELEVTSEEFAEMTKDIRLSNYEINDALTKVKSYLDIAKDIEKPFSDISYEEFKEAAKDAGVNMGVNESQLYIDFLQTFDESDLLETKNLEDVTSQDINSMDPEKNKSMMRAMKELSEVDTLEKTTEETTGLTQETIQEAGEKLKEKNIEVEVFDNVQFDEEATPEEVSDSMESWNEAVEEAQESNIETDNTATAVEIEDGVFKVPAEGSYGEILVKFEEGIDGSIKSVTHKVDLVMTDQITDEALKDNFRGIIRETMGEDYRSMHPDIVKNMAKEIKIYERVLESLNPGSDEFEYLENITQRKREVIQNYGDVLK